MLPIVKCIVGVFSNAMFLLFLLMFLKAVESLDGLEFEIIFLRVLGSSFTDFCFFKFESDNYKRGELIFSSLVSLIFISNSLGTS